MRVYESSFFELSVERNPAAAWENFAPESRPALTQRFIAWERQRLVTITRVIPRTFHTTVVTGARASIAPFGMSLESVFLPIALLVYYVILWRLVAHRPTGGAIVPQYSPPCDMTPAEMRYLRVGVSDNKSVGAVIAHMAARRLISVTPDGSEYLITRLVDELPGELPEEESDAFRAMFAMGDTTDRSVRSAVHWPYGNIAMQNAFRLRPDQGEKLLTIQAAISAALGRRLGDAYFKRNFEYSVPAVVLSSALAVGSAVSFQHADNIVLLTLLFVLWATGIGGIAVSNVAPVIRGAFEGRMSAANLITMAVSLLFFLCVLGFLGVRIAHISEPVFALSLLVTSLLNCSFPFLLQAPTKLGRERMDQVEGFREFLASVELDFIDRMNNPHWTPTLKIDYLAYAIALDLRQEWGDYLVNAMFNTVATGQ